MHDGQDSAPELGQRLFDALHIGPRLVARLTVVDTADQTKLVKAALDDLGLGGDAGG